jgi:hypothetical protein
MKTSSQWPETRRGGRANDRRDEGDEWLHVGKAGEVVLDAAAEGGELGERGLPQEKELLQEGSLDLLIRWDGDGHV